jgi:integrase
MEELKAVLRASNVEWRGMVLAGIYLGQRLKDIASLTWANVDLERGEIRLSTSKTGRRQIIPIAKPFKGYLLELPTSDDPNAPIFPDSYPLAMRSGGTAALSAQFYNILVSANLAEARLPNRKSKGIGRNAPREQSTITFHSLRHTATSWLKAAGVSEAVTRDLIGHESAEISRHYTHVDDQSKREAIGKLPDLTKVK